MKHYVVLVDLLKFYLDLVLKFNTFSYAVTGAIVSYYLSQPNTGFMRWALIFPLVVNLFLAGFAVYSALYVGYLDRELDRIKITVGLGEVPDATFLAKLLVLSGILCAVIVIILGVLLYQRPVT
ncbi:MAG: hypothetical protein M3Q99_07175 [Acidobacteriota bacterium]|nr:hypothetical protein [Acidobacteriota bacterium]